MSIEDATPEEWNEVNMNSEKKEEGTWTTN